MSLRLTNKRKSYKLQFKKYILIQLEQGKSKNYLHKKYSIPRSIIIDWEKQKKDIFEMKNISKRRNLLSKDFKQKAKFYENEIRMYNWFLEQRDQEKIVRPIDIRNKMLEDVNQNNSEETFKATNGWCVRLMNRWSLTRRKISGSGREFPNNVGEIIKNYLSEIKSKMVEFKFSEEEIIGFDEAAFYMDMLGKNSNYIIINDNRYIIFKG